jgi:hypothetical protein
MGQCKSNLSKELSLFSSSIQTHIRTPQIRLTTPNAPKSAPTHPRTTAGKTPAGINGSGALLKGTKLDEAAPLAAEPPVPPPVKFAPFGCGLNEISRERRTRKTEKPYPDRP